MLRSQNSLSFAPSKSLVCDFPFVQYSPLASPCVSLSLNPPHSNFPIELLKGFFLYTHTHKSLVRKVKNFSRFCSTFFIFSLPFLFVICPVQCPIDGLLKVLCTQRDNWNLFQLINNICESLSKLQTIKISIIHIVVQTNLVRNVDRNLIKITFNVHVKFDWDLRLINLSDLC